LRLPWKQFPMKFFAVLNIFFIIQDFWATSTCLEKQSLPWIFPLYGTYFLHSEFWATCACPEKTELPWNFLLHTFRSFEQLALAPKGRVSLEFFTVLKYFLSFRIFEKLALALKNSVSWNFSLYWMYFFHSGVLSNFRLLWKAEGALNSLYWICNFYLQEFWATCACPEKQSLPWNFSSPGGRQPPPPTPRLLRLWGQATVCWQ